MIIIFSPAKTFKPTTKAPQTTPVFFEQASFLAKKLQKKSLTTLKSSMRLSDTLAQQVHDYYQTFNQDIYPAIYSYMGQAYKALDIYDFNDQELKRLQDRLYIISGLYGLVKPLDGISYYRLEMHDQTLFSLVEYWKKPINTYFKKHHPDTGILNLASKEFSQLITDTQQMVTLNFLLRQGATLKSLSMHVKTMRGKFLKHIIQQDIGAINDLKTIQIDGYLFDAASSTEHEFNYIKESTDEKDC